MNELLIITLIESIYATYMYNYFKTTYSFHNPLEMLLNNAIFSDFFKHPMYSTEYSSKICLFGNYIGVILSSWILVRYILNTYYTKSEYMVKQVNTFIFCSVFIGSIIMNFNAFIYYIPLFIYELIQVLK